tara:strand:- start:192 stop:488 length:297 start_codon:yes stop_codon:yes gene_type:complete
MRILHTSAGSNVFIYIVSKMKWIGLLLTVALLPSCASKGWRSASDLSATNSAIYDPPHVTLKKGVEYQFVEGVLLGRGQKFHSEWSYRRAVVIGEGGK